MFGIKKKKENKKLKNKKSKKQSMKKAKKVGKTLAVIGWQIYKNKKRMG